MPEEKLSYRETARRFEINDHHRVQDWERIYLTEGSEGVTVERQGRGSGSAVASRGGLLKKFASLGFGGRATPAQKTQVVQKLRQKHSLEILLSIAQLPRATFYYHLIRMKRTDKHEAAKEEITAIYHENRDRYGYRRITADLRNRNLPLNHKTVQRLMKELGLVCRVRMKKYRMAQD